MAAPTNELATVKTIAQLKRIDGARLPVTPYRATRDGEPKPGRIVHELDGAEQGGRLADSGGRSDAGDENPEDETAEGGDGRRRGERERTAEQGKVVPQERCVPLSLAR